MCIKKQVLQREERMENTIELQAVVAETVVIMYPQRRQQQAQMAVWVEVATIHDRNRRILKSVQDVLVMVCALNVVEREDIIR